MDNVDDAIRTYALSVEQIGSSIAHLRGIPLLEALKHTEIGAGPYDDVSLFEAANRIMTDLVILHGVRWMLKKRTFPFKTYLVEYGNDDENGFDIRAEHDGKILIGEAFNVAKSFFSTKRGAMLKKLRNLKADFRILIFNHDAVKTRYVPETGPGEHFVLVDVGSESAKVVPNLPLERTVALKEFQ
ncbi:MAG: hypothetical protein HYT79_04130 [Elusimicrobia bacterium]|nr:hypothetical protein [Elusimicrobiota bacterium]